MCSEDPRIPARSILELSRMLHSHRPLPHGPLYVAYLSSFPPLVFLPCSSLSFLLVNMPLPTPIRISTRKGNRRLLQMLHTKRDIISLFPSPLSLSLSLSPSRSLFHFFFFFLREFPSIPPRFSSIASIYVPRDFRANYEIKGACSRALHVKRHVTTRETTLKFGDKRNQTASSMPNETEYLRV